VPRELIGDDSEEEDEVDWYEYNADGTPKVERVGPYLSSEAVRLAKPEELPGYDLVTEGGFPQDTDAESMKQPVILGAFGYPILYYVANPRHAARPRAYMAGYDPECTTCIVGVFDLSDNGLFTGQCGENQGCRYPSWDFEGQFRDVDDGHLIKDLGPTDVTDYGQDYVDYFVTDPAGRRTFPYYIMNKTSFESTYDPVQYNPSDASTLPTLTPYRRDSYLLITAGKDAIYGTDDDVTNFE